MLWLVCDRHIILISHWVRFRIASLGICFWQCNVYKYLDTDRESIYIVFLHSPCRDAMTPNESFLTPESRSSLKPSIRIDQVQGPGVSIFFQTAAPKSWMLIRHLHLLQHRAERSSLRNFIIWICIVALKWRVVCGVGGIEMHSCPSLRSLCQPRAIKQTGCVDEGNSLHSFLGAEPLHS